MRKLSKLNQERIINGLGIIPLEEQEQETFVNYMELLKQTKKVLKFTAIPHETPTKRKVVDPGT